MAPLWFRFYLFLVLYIEKISFLKILCYGPEVVGFQTKVILDLWGMTFHAGIVVALEVRLLLDFIWACCGGLFISLTGFFTGYNNQLTLAYRLRDSDFFAIKRIIFLWNQIAKCLGPLLKWCYHVQSNICIFCCFLYNFHAIFSYFRK